MLFHVGALWRLNELSFLPKLDRVSSVSGGSITAAVLGRNWQRLEFDSAGVAREFASQVLSPLRKLASHTIDTGSVLGGILTPGRSVADNVAAAYRNHLFGRDTLQNLPPDPPRFVINATNVQTGSLWRFSRKYMADYRIGVYPGPEVELAVAVGASSAFPPVLSPVRLSIDPNGWAQDGRGPLCVPPHSSDIVLTDGGVYDNLGLETAWKRYETILVSDGGGQMLPEPKVHADWPRHAIRINAIIDNQVRSMRKRQTIVGFSRGDRNGAYWGSAPTSPTSIPPVERSPAPSSAPCGSPPLRRDCGACPTTCRNGLSTGATPCVTPACERTWFPTARWRPDSRIRTVEWGELGCRCNKTNSNTCCSSPRAARGSPRTRPCTRTCGSTT